jgi:hypothetical protein
MTRLFAISLLFGAIAEAKLKLRTPSIVRITPFRSVAYFSFTQKFPVSRPHTSAVLSRSYIFFFRAASFFTDQTCVSHSLTMYRGWVIVLLPPKLVFKSKNALPRYGRIRILWTPVRNRPAPRSRDEPKSPSTTILSRPCVISQRGAAGCPPPLKTPPR